MCRPKAREDPKETRSHCGGSGSVTVCVELSECVKGGSLGLVRARVVTEPLVACRPRSTGALCWKALQRKTNAWY